MTKRLREKPQVAFYLRRTELEPGVADVIVAEDSAIDATELVAALRAMCLLWRETNGGQGREMLFAEYAVVQAAESMFDFT